MRFRAAAAKGLSVSFKAVARIAARRALVEITPAKGVRVPKKAVANIAARISSSNSLVRKGWKIVSSRAGYTHKGFRIRLLTLTTPPVGRLSEHYFFAALHPGTHEVLGMIGSFEAHGRSYLTTWNFDPVSAVVITPPGKGIGAALHTEAIHHYVRQGKPVANTSRVTNPGWLQFHRTIGWSISSRNVPYATAQQLKSRSGKESYQYYRLRRNPPEEAI